MHIVVRHRQSVSAWLAVTEWPDEINLIYRRWQNCERCLGCALRFSRCCTRDIPVCAEIFGFIAPEEPPMPLSPDIGAPSCPIFCQTRAPLASTAQIAVPFGMLAFSPSELHSLPRSDSLRLPEPDGAPLSLLPDEDCCEPLLFSPAPSLLPPPHAANKRTEEMSSETPTRGLKRNFDICK